MLIYISHMGKEINKDKVIKLQAQFLEEYENEVNELEKKIRSKDKEIELLELRIKNIKNINN